MGQIVESEMIMNETGRIVQRTWEALPNQFQSLVLDAFQIMPNHLHAVFVIPGPGLEPSLAQATGAPVIQPGSASPHAPAVGPGLAPPLCLANISGGASTQHTTPMRTNEADASTQGTTPLRPQKAGASPGPTGLGNVVGALKSISAIDINRFLSRVGQHVWQEDYFEHIIRDLGELETIRDYIIHNPQRWATDPENPDGA